MLLQCIKENPVPIMKMFPQQMPVNRVNHPGIDWFQIMLVWSILILWNGKPLQNEKHDIVWFQQYNYSIIVLWQNSYALARQRQYQSWDFPMYVAIATVKPIEPDVWQDSCVGLVRSVSVTNSVSILLKQSHIKEVYCKIMTLSHYFLLIKAT